MNEVVKLPTDYKEAGSMLLEWVRENPMQAAVYGLAGGLVVGFTGPVRLMAALQFMGSVKTALKDVSVR